MIEGVPVQFLPAYNALVEEALAEAKDLTYATTPTRVLRAEHLVAIALHTGRDKDRERVRMMIEHAPLDHTYLADIVRRHGLDAQREKWSL